jgi:DNA (cytosine-5)-methyltransferase 1
MAISVQVKKSGVPLRQQPFVDGTPWRVIDFFCGAGGFSEGFRRAGFQVIKGIDNWKPAMATHNANYKLTDMPKNVLDFENIQEIEELPDSELIIGSPPCVFFSLANRGGTGDKNLGIRLIEAFYRVIAVKKHQPHSILKAWLMENVPNSQNFIKENYSFCDLKLTNWALEHQLDPNMIALRAKENGAVLSAQDYGACQVRRRFVCGEITTDGQFPKPEISTNTPISLNTFFKDFPEPLSPISLNTLIHDPSFPDEVVAASDLHDHFYDTGVYEVEWRKARDLKVNHPYMGVMSFPDNRDKPSRTVMATRSSSTREAILYKSELVRTGDGEYRTPTLREAACIMGFPLTHQFFGDENSKWRQVGNAVCVQLSYALAVGIKRILGIRLEEPFVIQPDFARMKYLDDWSVKQFNAPPKRSSRALFRFHAIKKANMTVDLTNKIEQKIGDWGVVIHCGTGRGYKSVEVTREIREAAYKFIVEECPAVIQALKTIKGLHRYSNVVLNEKNATYGYTSHDCEHPFRVVEQIGQIITQELDYQDQNRIIDVSNSTLQQVKTQIPLSQLISIYAESVIIYGYKQDYNNIVDEEER